MNSSVPTARQMGHLPPPLHNVTIHFLLAILSSNFRDESIFRHLRHPLLRAYLVVVYHLDVLVLVLLRLLLCAFGSRLGGSRGFGLLGRLDSGLGHPDDLVDVVALLGSAGHELVKRRSMALPASLSGARRQSRRRG